MSARLMSESVEVVAQDYSTFGLSGDRDSLNDDFDPDSLSYPAAGGDMDRAGSSLVVWSPHQNNFALPMRVEVWSDEPPEDNNEWLLVMEGSITVEYGGLIYSSPTCDFATFEVPEGSFAVRVSGAGFVAEGWPGSTEPGDWWRVQLWPTDQSITPRRVKAWDGEPSQQIARPAWAVVAAAAAEIDAADPWQVVRPLLAQMRVMELERYGQNGWVHADRAMHARWAHFDMHIVRNVLRNCVGFADPEPLGAWTQHQVSVLRDEFRALHEVAPTVPVRHRSYYLLMDEIGQHVLAILDANVPGVQAKSPEDYPPLEAPSMAEVAQQLADTVASRIKNRKIADASYLTAYGSADSAAVVHAWTNPGRWINPARGLSSEHASDGNIVLPVVDESGPRHLITVLPPARPSGRRYTPPPFAPHTVRLEWNWLPAPGIFDDQPMLAEPCTVDVSSAEQLDGVVRTHLSFTAAPRSWIATLTTFWKAALAQAEAHARHQQR